MHVRRSALIAGLGLYWMSVASASDPAQAVVLYLNAHPGASALSLQEWIKSVGGFNSSVLKIDGDTYAILAGILHDEGCGGSEHKDDFSMISRAGSRYRVAWRWADTNSQRLAPWNQGVANLPPAANGHPRFYIDGLYPLCTGMQSLNQLSIWEWEGARAVPLMMKRYSYTILDQNEGELSFDGERIRIGVREDYKVFLGYMDGVHAKWTILVTPEGVVDLGRRKLDSDRIGLIDELYYRVKKNLDATDLATPEVIATLTRRFLQREIGRQFLDDVAERGNELCINGRIFRLSGSSFVSAVRELPPGPGACRTEWSSR